MSNLRQKIVRHLIDRDTLIGLRAFLVSILREDRPRIALVTGLALLGATAQIGFAFLLFKLFTSGTFKLGNFALNQSQLILILVTLGALSALVPYSNQRVIINSTTGYIGTNVRWLRGVLSNLESRFALFELGYNQSELTRLMSSEARYAGLSYTSVLQAIFPGFLFLGCFAALCFINAMWTLAVTLLIMPFLAFSIYVVLTGIERNEVLRATAIAHSTSAAKLVAGVNRHFSANRWGGRLGELADEAYDEAYIEAYGRRLSLSIVLTLVMDTLTFAIISIVGLLIVTGRLDLAAATRLLLYGLLLRFALGKMGACINQSVSVVSQLPYYRNFIAVKTKIHALTLKSESAGFDRTNFLPGEHIFLHPDGAAWSSAQSYIRDVLHETDSAAALQASIILSSGYPALFEDYQNSFQVSPLMTAERILVTLPASAHRLEDFRKLTSVAEKTITVETLREIPPAVRFLLTVRYAARNGFGKRIVFLDCGDFARLTAAERDWLSSLLSRAHVVYVSANPSVPRRLNLTMGITVWSNTSVRTYSDMSVLPHTGSLAKLDQILPADAKPPLIRGGMSDAG